MKDQDKTREQLIKELELLRLEHKALKTICEEDITVRKLTEEVLHEKERLLREFQLIGTKTDLPDRKQAEDILAQTRQNYEAFFNTIDEFLFVLDEQGNIIHMNNTVIDRLGYTREELIGKSVLMVHPPERRDEAGRIVGEMLSGMAEVCPVPVITKSGVQIPVETRVKHGIWDDKPAIFGVTKDISRLRLSEEKFSKLFHINPSACGLSDLDNHTYVEVNEAFYTLFGFNKDEVIGKTARNLGILTMETTNSILLHADNKGSVTNVEANLRAKNGDIKQVLLSAENIYVQDKKYRFTAVHDITERKQAENALLKSKNRYNNLISNIPVGVYVMHSTPEGTYAFDYVSPKVAEIFNMSAESFLADPQVGFKPIHPDDIDAFLTLNQERFQRPQQFEWEGRAVVNGTVKWLHIASSPELLENGDVIWNGVIADITDRKHIEENLRNSEKMYSSLYTMFRLFADNTDDFLWAKDIDKKFFFVNKTICERLLIANDINEPIGKTDVFFAMREREAHSENPDWHTFGEICADSDTITMNERIPKQFDEFGNVQGRFLYLDVHKAPIWDENGSLIGIVGTARDVTQTKNLEKEKAVSLESLRKSEENLQSLNAEKDKFFSIIAHDLRAPFNGFLGLTKLLAEGLSCMTLAEIQKIAVSMRSSATNLYSLLENLLEWSRMQQRMIPFNPVSIPLALKITEIVEQIRDSAQKKEIEVIYDIPVDLMVVADVHMIETVIRNLVSNAVKFTPKRGRITILAKRSDEDIIEISVCDTGIGINLDLRGKMFRINEQINRKGTEGEPSTGLGLIICKDFIEKHGGKLWLESEEGKGSTFYFTLAGNRNNEQLSNLQ